MNTKVVIWELKTEREIEFRSGIKMDTSKATDLIDTLTNSYNGQELFLQANSHYNIKTWTSKVEKR